LRQGAGGRRQEEVHLIILKKAVKAIQLNKKHDKKP
jgi:hypothetical protein